MFPQRRRVVEWLIELRSYPLEFVISKELDTFLLRK
jgi:hypothetical protein